MAFGLWWNRSPAHPGWQAVLRRYGVRWALMPAASPLASVLALSPGWCCRAMEGAGVAALCVRTAPPTTGSP